MAVWNTDSPQSIDATHAPRVSGNVRLVIVLSIIFSIGLFSPAFDNGFRDDDFAFLRHVTTSGGSLRALTSPQPNSFAFYRPGAWLLFAAEYALFGFQSGLYLLVNWLLHALNVWLAFCVLVSLRITPFTAAIATALFALGFGHYFKQIMWACTSGPLVAVTLSLVALYFSLRLVQSSASDSSARRQGLSFAIPTAACGLAPLFHEAALATPLLVTTLCSLRFRLGPRVLLRQTGLAWLFPLIWLGVLAALSREYGDYETPWTGFPQAAWLVFRYLGFMFFPLQATQLAPAFWIQIGLSVTVLVTLVWASWRGMTIARALAVWLLLTLFPFGFVGLPGRWLEMRYLYHAAIPGCALIAVIFTYIARRSNRSRRVFLWGALTTVVLGTIAFELVLEHKYDRYADSVLNREELEKLRGIAGIED